MTIHVFDAPETSRGNGSLLRAFGESHCRSCVGGGAFGVEVHGGGGEGSHEALDEAGHGVCANEAEDDEEELLQFGGWLE